MYKKLSYKIKATALAALILVASSCEVTDLSPANLIPEAEAFANPTRVNALVLGVYESAQRGWYLGAVQRGYPFGAATVQQGDMRGEDMYNDQLFYEITYTNGQTPVSANNNGQWESLYRMINRANIVLEGLDDAQSRGVLTQTERNTYRGEMLFMRAMAHHELLVYFCRPFSDNPNAPGVPYRTFAVNDVAKVAEGNKVGRGTVQAGYNQMLVDLNEAETLLPTTGTPFRVRQGAAVALKARIKMHMKDWAGVLTEYNKMTGFAVTADPVTPFRGGTSTDNVFSFQNTAASNPGVNGSLPNMYGNPDNGARGLVKISPLIWRADWWVQGDKRRSITTSSANRGIFTNKYIDPVNSSDNTVIIRFAEIVLTAAEAQARQGNLAEAVTLLNTVRNRALPAGAAPHTVASLVNADGVIDAIIKERRIEFLAEGRRWPDIHRLAGEGRIPGIPAKATSRSITNLTFYNDPARVIPTDHALAYSSHLFIWPIPLPELNNNPTPIEQNPGY